MARQNYKAEKRRRELERQKKQEAKREKRLHKPQKEDESDVSGGAEDAGSSSEDQQ